MRYRSYKVVLKAHIKKAMGVKEVMESRLQGHRAIRKDHRNERLSQGIHRIAGFIGTSCLMDLVREITLIDRNSVSRGRKTVSSLSHTCFPLLSIRPLNFQR